MLTILTYEVTAFYQKCRLIFDATTKNAVITDPGAEANLLYKEVEKLGLHIQAILLTHGHLDHAGAARELASLFNCPLIGPHKADEVWLSNMNQQAQMFDLSPADNVIPDRWLNDGDKLNLNLGEEIEVLHCPGHTPGHVCFYFATSGFVVSGDVLFAGSVGRSDFPFGDPEELITSIKSKLLTLPDKTKVLPGHGSDTTIAREKMFNPYLT